MVLFVSIILFHIICCLFFLVFACLGFVWFLSFSSLYVSIVDSLLHLFLFRLLFLLFLRFLPLPFLFLSSSSLCIPILCSSYWFLVSFSPFFSPSCCSFSSFSFPVLRSPPHLFFPLFLLLPWLVFSCFSPSPRLLLLAFLLVLLSILLFLFSLLLSGPPIFYSTSSSLPSSSASWVLSFFDFSSSIGCFFLSFPFPFLAPSFSLVFLPPPILFLLTLLSIPFGFSSLSFLYVFLRFPFVCTYVLAVCGFVFVFLFFSPLQAVFLSGFFSLPVSGHFLLFSLLVSPFLRSLCWVPFALLRLSSCGCSYELVSFLPSALGSLRIRFLRLLSM